MRQVEKEWFDTWFDTPYYHILYKNRDFEEASAFIHQLYRHLNLTYIHKALDVACGKGRHSIHLNQLGLDVTGIDLSKESILMARQFENETLHFYEHDMRLPFRENYFDFVLNLFTSFGYFSDNSDNEKAINAMATNLKPNGILLLDFFNPQYVKDNLVGYEEKTIDGVNFIITKKIEKDFIVKTINVEDKGKEYAFEEKVKAISRVEFQECFKLAGLTVEQVYGSYTFQDFDPKSSERMIFIARK